ncbi:hypothetical protein N7G274_008082 [Stereocaulon virgatum]|uniref:Sld7 C-terminal domain-containing protein n=1 Tax=Stereocaulon virgatum TaxID=373712 RepID=A0ABR4A1X2_9LECA
MTEVWSGVITTNNPAASIEDIHFWTSRPNVHDVFPRDARLHYLSLVHVPRIPIYLAAGPSLEVSTDNEAASKWLNESILVRAISRDQDGIPSEPWWCNIGAQSDHGILLRVKCEGDEQADDNATTEVLLYGAVETDVAAFPTPPASSSPAPPDEHLLEPPSGSPHNVKLYALPLCSKVFGRAERAAGLLSPSPEACRTPNEACFLPHGLDQAREAKTVHHKRQSLSSLFDDATQKRRKLKGRGGESISQAMAGIDRHNSRHGLPPNIESKDLEKAHLPQEGSTSRRGLTRASTIMSIASSDYPQPASRSCPLVNGKRSSLHRVESAISPRDSPTLSEMDNSFAHQNKAALTKVIMAGVRLHGLQQRKRTGKESALEERPRTAASINNSSGLNEAEDEYKMVYHQTFKAATFAFRKHFSAQAISQELMRDVVDRILTIFCSDPLATTGLHDSGLVAFGNTGGDSLHAFDKPTFVSSSKPGNFSSPPTAKRR